MPAPLVLDDRPTEQPPADDQHVAAVHSGRRFDLAQRAMARELLGDRWRFGPARHRARSRHDRHVVQHDGRILDKDAVRHLVAAGQADDLVARVRERGLIGGVLAPGTADVDWRSRQVRQLADAHRGADLARQRDSSGHAGHDSRAGGAGYDFLNRQWVRP